MPKKQVKTGETDAQKPLFNSLPYKYRINDYQDTLDLFQRKFGKTPIKTPNIEEIAISAKIAKTPIFHEKMKNNSEIALSENFSKKPIFLEKMEKSEEMAENNRTKPLNCYSVDLLVNKVKDFSTKEQRFGRGKGIRSKSVV